MELVKAKPCPEGANSSRIVSLYVHKHRAFARKSRALRQTLDSRLYEFATNSPLLDKMVATGKRPNIKRYPQSSPQRARASGGERPFGGITPPAARADKYSARRVLKMAN
ncbi:hypothetical protein MSG28_008390 [Choristoneura fumiferana]|uniref:Uncharacterized protein n=1 Tax=Choristoneura fumiferana TaxID=7141 RepID=A0ACC0J5X9_CHOFU|nr:hypothetical protein MSG28_008390 [Choristoneura fumiferana]